MIRISRDTGVPPWEIAESAPADWIAALEGFYAYEHYMTERESRGLKTGGGYG